MSGNGIDAGLVTGAVCQLQSIRNACAVMCLVSGIDAVHKCKLSEVRVIGPANSLD